MSFNIWISIITQYCMHDHILVASLQVNYISKDLLYFRCSLHSKGNIWGVLGWTIYTINIIISRYYLNYHTIFQIVSGIVIGSIMTIILLYFLYNRHYKIEDIKQPKFRRFESNLDCSIEKKQIQNNRKMIKSILRNLLQHF